MSAGATAHDLIGSRERFLAALRGVSAAQWSWKPHSAEWSVAEITEHVTVVEMGVSRLLSRAAATPVSGEARAAVQGKEAVLTHALLDRGQRISAPDATHPTGRWPVQRAAIAAFEQARAAIVAYADNPAQDPRGHIAAHPLLGPLDGVQWVRMVWMHSDRHARQIEALKATAGYPA